MIGGAGRSTLLLMLMMPLLNQWRFLIRPII